MSYRAAYKLFSKEIVATVREKLNPQISPMNTDQNLLNLRHLRITSLGMHLCSSVIKSFCLLLPVLADPLFQNAYPMETSTWTMPLTLSSSGMDKYRISLPKISLRYSVGFSNAPKPMPLIIVWVFQFIGGLDV